MLRAVPLAALAALALTLPAQALPLTVDVLAAGFQFAPEVLVVPAGTTVVWHGTQGLLDHTVTTGPTTDPIVPRPDAAPGDCGNEDDRFNCALPADAVPAHPGATFSHTFGAPGTYPYSCATHYLLGGMRGAVVVV
jgi:plastocyanin